MDIIHLLPDSVANQIAAGEVIQRPASCLKELVENSLDAGATHIQIILRDAGKTLLQVIDDGQGMSETDVRMSFERHATSKIKQASDLFSLHTMGFRGEALASICAVAQVEVSTRRAEDEIGTRLEVHGSTVMNQDIVQCPVGTNMKVKNLFYNVPARRKFLKTDQTELRNIWTEFYHIVLVNPKVQFTLIHQDEVLIDLPAGTEKQRIEQIFSRSSRHQFTSQLVDIALDTDLVSIRGFVGKPEAASKDAKQYFFVNGRYMRHPYFHKAVLTAYTGMLQADCSPSYFIYFDINPENIDVNIHPTKTEIKFADEQPIFQLLLATVREALGKFNVAPALNLDMEGKMEFPHNTGREGQSSSLPTTSNTDYNPFHPTSPSPRWQPTPSQGYRWQQLYEQPEQEAKTAQPLIETPVAKPTSCYQYAGRYILYSSDEGLMVVDQHRAHACVLYNSYYHQMETAQTASQQLLFPEVWEVGVDNIQLVEQLLYDLHAIGFDLQRLDRQSFSIMGIPPRLDVSQAIDTLQEIVQTVREVGTSVRETYRSQIGLRLAYRTAIPYGKTLTTEEMTDLIGQLIALPQYQLLPDGKRIVTYFDEKEIAKRF